MTVLPTYNNKKHPPAAKSKKTTPSTTQSSNQNPFISTIFEGISFGTGSAIGHNIINKFSTIFSQEKEIKKEVINCEDFLKKFEDCKKNYGNSKKEWNTDSCLDLSIEYENCRNRK